MFKGQLLAPLQMDGVTRINKIVPNSGAGAMIAASLMGATRIIMLGYDCKKNDKVHWHGDHPAPLGNAHSINKWPAQFRKAAKHIKCEVVNASRDTALDMFERINLEDALN